MATGPKNQYNVVNPTGTGAVNYTDNHYMDGDGALYWTGMIAQRVLVKGEGLTSGGGLTWSGSTTARTLGLNPAMVATSTTPSIIGGVYIADTLQQNYGGNMENGVYTIPYMEVGYLTNHVDTSNGLTINTSGTGSLVHEKLGLNINTLASSLPLYTPLQWDNANNKIKLVYGTGLTLVDGALVVDTSTIVPNITGTAPITVTTNDNSKTIGLNIGDGLKVNEDHLEIDTDNTLRLYGQSTTKLGIKVPEAPLHFDSSTGALELHVGNGLDVVSSELSVKDASTSQKGIVQLQDSISDSVTTKAPTVNAVYDAIAAAVADLEAADFEFVIAATLPTPSADYKQKIYLIPISGASQPDTYAEYVCINTSTTSTASYRWEKIGDTNIDLSGYIQKTDVLTSSDIDEIIDDVFGF